MIEPQLLSNASGVLSVMANVWGIYVEIVSDP